MIFVELQDPGNKYFQFYINPEFEFKSGFGVWISDAKPWFYYFFNFNDEYRIQNMIDEQNVELNYNYN